MEWWEQRMFVEMLEEEFSDSDPSPEDESSEAPQSSAEEMASLGVSVRTR